MTNKNIVKDIRTKCCLTQAELSDLLGVSFSTISRWESGATIPNLEEQDKLEAISCISFVPKRELVDIVKVLGLNGAILMILMSSSNRHNMVESKLCMRIHNFIRNRNPDDIVSGKYTMD